MCNRAKTCIVAQKNCTFNALGKKDRYEERFANRCSKRAFLVACVRAGATCPRSRLLDEVNRSAHEANCLLNTLWRNHVAEQAIRVLADEERSLLFADPQALTH